MSEDQITLAIQSSEGRKRLKISLETSGSTLKTVWHKENKDIVLLENLILADRCLQSWHRL